MSASPHDAARAGRAPSGERAAPVAFDREPMIAYVGQTRAPDLIAELEHHAIGECVVTGELPPRRAKAGFFMGRPALCAAASRASSEAGSQALNISSDDGATRSNSIRCTSSPAASPIAVRPERFR